MNFPIQLQLFHSPLISEWRGYHKMGFIHIQLHSYWKQKYLSIPQIPLTMESFYNPILWTSTTVRYLFRLFPLPFPVLKSLPKSHAQRSSMVPSWCRGSAPTGADLFIGAAYLSLAGKCLVAVLQYPSTGSTSTQPELGTIVLGPSAGYVNWD